MDDPTIITAFAYYIIGGVLLIMAGGLVCTHPVNRVFFLGKYFTSDGARVLMRSWPMASLFGLFIFSCAVEHHLHWVYDHGHPQAKSVALLFIGWVEAGTALLTAILVLLGAVIWGVRKWTDK